MKAPLLRTLLALTLGCSAATPALTQAEWPQQPINLVMTFWLAPASMSSRARSRNHWANCSANRW